MIQVEVLDCKILYQFFDPSAGRDQVGCKQPEIVDVPDKMYTFLLETFIYI